MELLVWEKSWGLPSIEAESLSCLAYCKFSHAPVEVKRCNNDRKSPTGLLPTLKDESIHCTGETMIINDLKSRGYDLDYSLKSEHQSDLLAYTRLIKDKLIPAVQYTFWGIKKNYMETTHSAWTSILPFPQSIYLPIRKKIAFIMETEKCHSMRDVSKEEKENKILSDAKECLNLLDFKLGEEREFFFGEKPTSLDARIFSQLALLIHVRMPESVLQNHVKNCTNLMKFCQRILKKYFPESAEETAHLEREFAEKEKQKLRSLEEYPNSKRDVVIAVTVVTGLMLTYAVMTGKIRFQLIDLGGWKK